jgi:hypothetical protein
MTGMPYGYDDQRVAGPNYMDEIDEEPACGQCDSTKVRASTDSFGVCVRCDDCGAVEEAAWSQHFVWYPQTDGTLSPEEVDE